ncbi:MAG: acetate/propionate family kinase [Anaerobacillus sp.]|uniref:acetate/propionate family kinase n=1 Tax=Anaerobacillus sp. TaxID=1872506 RepID=UPI003918E14A
MQKILAINAGSSSLRFQLFEMPKETVIVKGSFERIGNEGGLFSITTEDAKNVESVHAANHKQAVEYLLERLRKDKIIQDLNEIAGIGHRVAHGGEEFTDSCVIDDSVLKKIESLADLAPLHNPANCMGISALRAVIPNAVSVAVFDTSFHQTMPEETFLYPIPYELYTENRIRKYGFHGTSHKYIASQVAEVVGKPLEALRIISCHLGNGASICAIDKGRSINTSMGLTPIAGLMMGTRSGEIDPSIIPYIKEKTNQPLATIMDMLNRQSGLLGISGLSNDLRDLEEAEDNGNSRAALALNMFTTKIREYIGAYASTMNGFDVLVFTAGIGENSSRVRKKVLDRLSFLGISYDPEQNKTNDVIISREDSLIKVCIIPTNEEVMIARDVHRLLNGNTMNNLVGASFYQL